MTSFTFGGTALTSFGKVTLLDDYLSSPTRRGDNITIPYRHGTVFVQKYYDQRKLVFGMAITAATATALETVFDNMRKLFAVRTEQVLAMTLEDSSVRNISATVNSPLQVTRKTGTFALVVVDFDCAAAEWRLSTAITDNTTAITTTPNAMTVTNPGTVDERDPTIVIHGAFSSITITNSTNGASLTYSGAIGTGETVTISTINGEYSAVLSTGSANVIGNLTHSGSASLLPLNVGANTLAITNAGRDANSTVKVSFYAPFL
jgi:phage-related protein